MMKLAMLIDCVLNDFMHNLHSDVLFFSTLGFTVNISLFAVDIYGLLIPEMVDVLKAYYHFGEPNLFLI